MKLVPLSLAFAAIAGSACADTLPKDAVVRTKADAIKIAIHASYGKENRPDLWHVKRHGSTWDAWMERSDVPCAKAEEMQIDAIDGIVSGRRIFALPMHTDPSCEDVH